MIQNEKFFSSDIVVVGAGPAGLTAALALAKTGADVICAGPPHSPDPERPDTRTTALLLGSVKLLETLGVWKMCVDKAAPLKAIRLIDDTGRLLRAPDIEFRAEEIEKEAFGYNIPNTTLVSALHEQIRTHTSLHYMETDAVTEIKIESGSLELRLAEDSVIRTQLVVGADGRKSLARQTAGIKTSSWAYEQTALACNFEHTHSHEYISTEFHRSTGPFTVVPLPGHASSLVWVERPDHAEKLKKLNDESFIHHLEERLQGLLGTVTSVGPRASFPLSGLSVQCFARQRIALVGEAAHVIPPIGAQGLNLGFRDVATLTNCIASAPWAHDPSGKGKDYGADHVLQAYDEARRADVWSRTFTVDLLNRSLISNLLPIQAMRSAGLHLLNMVAPLRRFIILQGLGSVDI